jgi:hypothetical protein
MPEKSEVIEYLKKEFLKELSTYTDRVSKVESLISERIDHETLTKREKEIIYRVKFLAKHASPFPTEIKDMLEWSSVHLEGMRDLAEACERRALNPGKLDS